MRPIFHAVNRTLNLAPPSRPAAGLTSELALAGAARPEMIRFNSAIGSIFGVAAVRHFGIYGDTTVFTLVDPCRRPSFVACGPAMPGAKHPPKAIFNKPGGPIGRPISLRDIR
jgi:hypothetical protein